MELHHQAAVVERMKLSMCGVILLQALIVSAARKEESMGSIVGFALLHELSSETVEKALAAQCAVLSHFSHLDRVTRYHWKDDT